MFFHEPELQYEVTVEDPDPHFAKLLQQAIGGQEGEMRVALQYMFQAWAVPEQHKEYRNLLMETAAEELGHIEMLASAVTKNLRGSSKSMSDTVQETAETAEAMTAQGPRQFLSSGQSAMPVDSNGAPFTGNYIVASGNLAGDLYANVMAESTGRTLATRLWEYTADPGMKDMLSYLIARDTMHQNQWLQALETLDDPVPVPASFPQEEENQEYNYTFMSTRRDEQEDPDLPWTQGDAPDGKGQFSYTARQPGDGEVVAPDPDEMTHDEPNASDE
ncbi:manganese catalase family protein [Natrinema sp. 1APR25-10V2]|uniref:manganese catalase family protein n=1 Tax=Natrinema sp. 1APR25-10V2 TaxID=2951081 RepID=UPI0028755E17|nr:manganese catalase family protein [Natrinema sp. 1APR25-10V2]MDS0478034.1 manganese catalase family protein [Natrinema sp. 1APR25-10V2]